MSTKKKLLEAAAGNAGGGATYVDDVFSTYLYTGTNTVQTITNGIDLAGEGGLVWTKNRDNNANEIDHQLMDSEQGTFRYILESNKTNARFDFGTSILTPSSTGFQLSSASRVNQSANPYVSWTFRKQPGFFDVVTYTGNGISGRTVSHNLGSTPAFIAIKRTSEAGNDWQVYHKDADGLLHLNTTAAASAVNAKYGFGDDTTAIPPTSSVFTISSQGAINNNGSDYVAYLFAHDAQDFGTDEDESIIKCGSYTGNGNAVGPTIDLGWEPQFIMVKSSSSSGNWIMLDSMRGVVSGGYDEDLYANLTYTGTPNIDYMEFTATGFIPKSNNGATNGSGSDYIYMAIRRPHKPAEEFAATDLFDVTAYTGAGAGTSVTTGFPVDMTLVKGRDTAYTQIEVWNRLRGQREYLFTDSTVPAGNFGSNQWTVDNMTGYTWATANGYASGSGVTYVTWNFKRAPGFFDVVTYTGTGSAHAEAHNLGVVPEMIIVKSRSNSFTWTVYHKDAPISSSVFEELNLNTTGAWQVGNSAFPATAPTSTGFYLPTGTASASNRSGWTYVAYLFATEDGVSKVGSYTGTGAALNVDCGFSAGARFILAKRTDSTGDWYVWDSVRGIVAGNDPYLLLNSDAAEVTNTDYIDPLSSGFTVTSSAPAALNASGGTYIFYAIA
jgi:hypothetical protein